MKSMTGFGRAKQEKNNRIYQVEIKSVNHKYNDINIKLPRSLSYLEDKIKKELSSNIERGKVDVFISFENYSNEGKQVVINHELAKEYVKQLKIIAEENSLNVNIPATEITRMPEVLTLKESELSEEIIENELIDVLKDAIKAFTEMRQNEGDKIKEDLLNRIEEVAINVEKVNEYSSKIVEEYIEKLRQRVKEILKTDVVDEARLAMEVVLYADKCSVEEEITRLRSHISQFKSLLKQDRPVGKKIDFLIQEMNRETNTIGSKSGSLEITNLVVEIKTEIEDIREQVQNIE